MKQSNQSRSNSSSTSRRARIAFAATSSSSVGQGCELTMGWCSPLGFADFSNAKTSEVFIAYDVDWSFPLSFSMLAECRIQVSEKRLRGDNHENTFASRN